MNILLDVDGVLAGFTYAFTKTAAKLGLVDRPWSDESQLTWSFQFDVDKVWKAVDTTPYWWGDLEPLVDGVIVDRINRLHDNHRVYFCTNRQGGIPDVKLQTHEWLLEIGFNWPSVIVAKNKGEIAKALHIDYAIDDKLSNVVDIHNAGAESYMLEKLYNRGSWDDAHTVGSVDEFLQVVEGATGDKSGR